MVLETYKFPFIDVSLRTNRRLFSETSPPVTIIPFEEARPATDVAPTTVRWFPTTVFPFTLASPTTNKRLFIETSPEKTEEPETSNVERGFVLPMPTFPL